MKNQRKRSSIENTAGVIGPILHLRPPTHGRLMIAAIIINPRSTKREEGAGVDPDQGIESAHLPARGIATKNGRGQKRNTNTEVDTVSGMTGSIGGEAGVARDEIIKGAL